MQKVTRAAGNGRLTSGLSWVTWPRMTKQVGGVLVAQNHAGHVCDCNLFVMAFVFMCICRSIKFVQHVAFVQGS
jgi:hypothetical protein